MLTVGLAGMLAIVGMEYSCSVLLAIVFDTDGAWMMGSIASRAAKLGVL
jgi:hypothetical protein